MASTEIKTYRGNCHCGRFVFEVDYPEIKTATECNCSICLKKGYLWIFPVKENLKMIKGDDNTLTKYAFGQKTTIHCFCPTCGTPVMGFRPNVPAGGTIGLNVRCLQGVDIWVLKIGRYDGATLPPAYEPPVYTGQAPQAEVEGGKTYHGSCHCGAVTFVANVEPLDAYTGTIRECNCSICVRNGYIWIYPFRPQVVIQGEENLQYYSFKDALWHKTFCKICGVQLYNERNDDLSPKVIAAAPEVHREFYREGQTPYRPINLRTLNDLDYGLIQSLDVEHNEGWEGLEPQYVNP